jgi:hypothetical protein
MTLDIIPAPPGRTRLLVVRLRLLGRSILLRPLITILLPEDYELLL